MFICKYCEEEFRDSKELKKHMRICDCNPDNQTVYRCRCGETFMSKDEYKKHLRSCQQNDNQDRYDDLDDEF